MKRIVLWVLSTLSTLVVLFGYHTSTSSVMATGNGSDGSLLHLDGRDPRPARGGDWRSR